MYFTESTLVLIVGGGAGVEGLGPVHHVVQQLALLVVVEVLLQLLGLGPVDGVALVQQVCYVADVQEE